MAVVASPTVAIGFVGSNADVDCFRLLRSTRVAVFVTMVAKNNVNVMAIIISHGLAGGSKRIFLFERVKQKMHRD